MSLGQPKVCFVSFVTYQHFLRRKLCRVNFKLTELPYKDDNLFVCFVWGLKVMKSVFFGWLRRRRKWVCVFQQEGPLGG